MDRKLFDEAHLLKNLPKTIISAINSIENDISPSLFDRVFESEELKCFISSPILPKVEETCKKSILAMEVKKKLENLNARKNNKKPE